MSMPTDSRKRFVRPLRSDSSKTAGDAYGPLDADGSISSLRCSATSNGGEGKTERYRKDSNVLFPAEGSPAVRQVRSPENA